MILSRLQHLQRRDALPAAVGGSLPAARLPERGRPRGAQPGVPPHPAAGAAAAPGQAHGGGAELLLPAGVPPHRRGLHVRATLCQHPAVRSDAGGAELQQLWGNHGNVTVPLNPPAELCSFSGG